MSGFRVSGPPAASFPLPDELIAQVIGHLSDRDAVALRGVSRAVRAHVEDGHVWMQRGMRHGWLRPASQPALPGDAVKIYSAQVYLRDEPPGMLMRRGVVDCSTARGIERAAARYPRDMPELLLSSVPDAAVWPLVTRQWPNLRRIDFVGVASEERALGVDGLRDLPHLESLTFERSGSLKAHDLQAIVTAAPKLTHLKFDGLVLEGDVLDALTACAALTFLALRNASLRALPDSFTTLSGVTSLDLSTSRDASASRELLTSVARCFPALTSLDLSGRRVEHVEDLALLADLPLRTLRLSKTGIRTLPHALCKPGIETLAVSQNEGFQLPDAARGITTLVELNLACNALSDFPSVLNDIPSLVKVDVTANAGIRFNANMGGMTNLREFVAIRCALPRVPGRLLQARNIERLRLRGNAIKGLPTRLNRLTRLTHLELADNSPWTRWPKGLRAVPTVRWLALPQLAGDALPAFAHVLPRLRYLSIDSTPRFFDMPLGDAVVAPLMREQFLRALDQCTNLRWVAHDDMVRDLPWPKGVQPYMQGNRNFVMSYTRD